MKLPDNKVPTRKQWQTLRDKSGGKKGLAKVSIGKALDNFHGAAAKVSSNDDIAKLTKTITALDKDLNAYVAVIAKNKKYNELTSTVKREMLAPLGRFTKGLTDMATAGMKEIKQVESQAKTLIDFSNKNSAKMQKEADAILIELRGMQKKYRDDIPAEDKPAIVALIKDAAKRAEQFVSGATSIDKELVTFVGDNIGEHRPVVKKFEKQLGAAKGAAGAVKTAGKQIQGEVTAIAQSLRG